MKARRAAAPLRSNSHARPNTRGEPLAEEYRHLEYDPLMLQVSLLIRNSKFKVSKLAEETGISRATFANWESKRTKRPQAATLRFALRALGKTLKIVDER